MGDSGSGQCCRVLSRVSSMLKNEVMSDVIFVVGPSSKTFHCHKFVLGSSSQVFQTMFYGNIPERGEVRIPDVTEAAFEIMLKYLYSDKVKFRSPEDALDVAYVSKKYMLHDLFSRCEKFLLSSLILTPQNVCQTYEQVHMLDMDTPKKKSLYYMARNFSKIFQSDDFPIVSKSILQELLRLDVIDMDSEVDLLQVICRWAIQECERNGLKPERESIRLFIGDLFKEVRFLCITTAELKKVNEQYGFFDSSEEISLLLCISLPRNGSLTTMPCNFNASTRKRSVANSERIKFPTEYRYNSHCKLLRLSRHQETVRLNVHKGQLVILGIVVGFKPIPEYSEHHRYANIEVEVQTVSSKAVSVSKTRYKLTNGREEEKFEQIFDEFLVIPEQTEAVIRVFLDGEGIKLAQLVEEEISAQTDHMQAVLAFSSSGETDEGFCLKELMWT